MKNLPTLTFALLSSLLFSCASPAEGFTLDIQLSGVRTAAVDNVRLILTPVMAPGSTTAPRFQPPEVSSFEDGAIQMSVDDDGQLVIAIEGAYFRANSTPTGAGDLDPRFSLELWSDDTTARMMTPQIRGIVTANGFDAAAGAAYLPSWPLELGETFTLTVACTTGREMECTTAP